MSRIEADERVKAIEQFWDGEHDIKCMHLRGAVVCSFLSSEISYMAADSALRKSFVEVLNFVADCTENEDMRIEG